MTVDPSAWRIGGMDRRTASRKAALAQSSRIAVEIVRKQEEQIGFAAHPRRWVVGRCFAWLRQNRRLSRDFEATIASATNFVSRHG